MQKKETIDLLLDKLKKKQLCEFIKQECDYDEGVRNRFLALGAGSVFKPKQEDYTSRILDLIEFYGGRYGYVEYDAASKFSCDVCRILDEATLAMKNCQWEVAIAVLSGVASVGEDIINCGDDSSGDLGYILDYCFELWQELCDKEGLPEELKSKIFDFAVTSFSEARLSGFDWWWSWIEMAISFADTSAKQEHIIRLLDNVKNMESDEYIRRYNVQKVQEYKFKIITKTASQHDIRKFMYDNVGTPKIREKLLQMLWDEENYDEVLRLAKDGVSHDADWAGLVNDWHRWELKVYRHNHDKENTLSLARHFFFSGSRWGDREFSMEKMYSLMASIIPAEEWLNYVETLISKASKREAEVQTLFIYTQEKMWDRYMEYLRQNPSIYSFDDAPNVVRELYNDEFVKLYASEVRCIFQNASNRDAYREGVNILRKLIKYGGKEYADKICAEQKARTPRRPALIDELSKL